MTIEFLAGGQPLAGSGLTFCGPKGFGYPVRVGEHQDRTFAPDGAELLNTKYHDDYSVALGQAGRVVPLEGLGREFALLTVRFTHDSPVRVLRAFVGGLEGCYVAEVGESCWRAVQSSGMIELTPKPEVAILYEWDLFLSVAPSEAGKREGDGLFAEVEFI